VTVGGLDLAKARDHSALVTLAVGPDHCRVTTALRLPHWPYREQIAALTPLLGDLCRLAYDAGGVGAAVGELLPASAIPIVITAGSSVSRHGAGWRVGKVRLVADLLHLAGAGRLVVPPGCRGADDLRRELQSFAWMPTKRGVRLEARGGAHDDLVMAAALAVFASRIDGTKGGNA
jgi:phage FluMu gp28-like protein